jgi:hypothetical protein
MLGNYWSAMILATRTPTHIEAATGLAQRARTAAAATRKWGFEGRTWWKQGGNHLVRDANSIVWVITHLANQVTAHVRYVRPNSNLDLLVVDKALLLTLMMRSFHHGRHCGSWEASICSSFEKTGTIGTRPSMKAREEAQQNPQNPKVFPSLFQGFHLSYSSYCNTDGVACEGIACEGIAWRPTGSIWVCLVDMGWHGMTWLCFTRLAIAGAFCQVKRSLRFLWGWRVLLLYCHALG